jgi:hypothetical protein
VSTTNDGESIVATATANQQQTDEEKVNTTETVNDPVEPPASISAVYATTNAPAITIT